MKIILTKKQLKVLYRLVAAALVLAVGLVFKNFGESGAFPVLDGSVTLWNRDFSLFSIILFFLFLIPYFIAGYDVVAGAFKRIFRGQFLDENFLMVIATLGAFALGEYSEAVFVMVFYQTGELFQSYAVNKSRREIAAMMNIKPDFAVLFEDGTERKVAPEEVLPGSLIVVKAGEKIPLDGIVEKGNASIDTKALTGESIPVLAETGSEVLSGSINLNGLLYIKIPRCLPWWKGLLPGRQRRKTLLPGLQGITLRLWWDLLFFLLFPQPCLIFLFRGFSGRIFF